ncbi:MAG: hypothetical protein AVO35_00470 [Candidatus Aegiribacteria sp. MLS_C]|nr:MAG: hypothetical protein AVO35_00470 [Candidatus Aegiribacteria sp. MLS_C]
MGLCFFCSDLHGDQVKYRSLFEAVLRDGPEAVFLGGDLFPGAFASLAQGRDSGEFLEETLAGGFLALRQEMSEDYPEVFVILGNDDGRYLEPAVLEWDSRGLWHYSHGRFLDLDRFRVFGYSYVPPTPFMLKDWEKYDVSRFVDPGSVHPSDGMHSVPVSDYELAFSTIRDDLSEMTSGQDLSDTIMLFHSPPYGTDLDRAALDGVQVDHAPLDVHVGSIAISRLIKAKQPLVTLHGHVHESASLTGRWMERMGGTFMFSAGHDGPELALVEFDPENPASAVRELL